MTGSFQRRVAELQQRRELLVERAAVQRGELAAVCAEFSGPLHWINHAASAAGWLRRRPGAAGLSVLTALLALSGARPWIRRAMLLYQLVKFLRDRFAGTQVTPTLAVRSDMEAT